MRTWQKLRIWGLEFALFAMAVSAKFVYVLGGALLSAGIFLYEHAAGRATSWATVEVLMALSLLLAMFEAWRDEKDRSDRTIGSMSLVGDVPATVLVLPHGPNETSLVIPLRIRNRGEATIISSYSASLTVSGDEILGRPQGFRGKVGMVTADGLHAIEYEAGDLIEPHGTTQPIPRGGQLRGIIFVRFPLAEESARDCLRTLRVTFADVTDRQYKAELARGAIEGGVNLMPGVGVARRLDGKPTKESASGPIE